MRPQHGSVPQTLSAAGNPTRVTGGTEPSLPAGAQRGAAHPRPRARPGALSAPHAHRAEPSTAAAERRSLRSRGGPGLPGRAAGPGVAKEHRPGPPRPAPPPWRCASPPTSHGSSRSCRHCRRGWKRRRRPGSERWRRLGRRAARPRSCGPRRSGRGCRSRSSTSPPVRPRPAAPPVRGVARTLRRPCRSLPGDPEAGELGLAAVPGRQAAFRQGLEAAVRYARAVGCPRIHVMAGRVPLGTDRAAVAGEMETTFIENLRYTADLLSQEDMIGLLEPINNRITDPRYYLNTPHQAAAILEKVGRPNLKLQLDLFHCQIMDGNLSRNLETYFPLIGHIQIAQVPGRHEPDSPGELNFPYIFELLESLGYTGYVGCEYAPKGDTLEGLGWLRSYWESRGLQHGGTSKAAK
uniref:Hydroxypyruvate isomerase (putative) n=2 Tax=Passeriformes TaxID=9126 RepID=H0ZA29_TAEGU